VTFTGMNLSGKRVRDQPADAQALGIEVPNALAINLRTAKRLALDVPARPRIAGDDIEARSQPFRMRKRCRRIIQR
jgi:hypothetical protein